MMSPTIAARKQIAATPQPTRSSGGRPLFKARKPAQAAPAMSPRPCIHHRSSLAFVMYLINAIRDDLTRAHPPLTLGTPHSAGTRERRPLHLGA
jgi:hypothetical protein